MSENTSFLLTNARYLGVSTDVLVENGVIKSVGKSGSAPAPAGTETIDGRGHILFPGFIDAHTHLREPGYEWKEDINSGLAAAANGGFSAVMCMANTKPVNDKAAVTRLILDKAQKSHPHGPRLYPIGALTVGLEGAELAPMAELAEAGCVAFSNDGKPVTNTEIFRRSMEYASMWNKVVIDHCEDPFMAKGSHMNEGYVSGIIGVKGQPAIAEALHVARDILLAEYLDLPVHLAHISCRQSVELIVWAKSRGVKVTAETCPHYLRFTEEMVYGYNTAAKVNPPLRTENDVKYLRSAVADGVFDMFVTDHAPHAPHEKEEPLDEAPQGIMGLETALPLTYDLVRDNVISEKQLIDLWSAGPAKVFNLLVNTMNVGDPADFALFDPDARWILDDTSVKTKGRNTPLWGKNIRGKVSANWVGGHQIV